VVEPAAGGGSPDRRQRNAGDLCRSVPVPGLRAGSQLWLGHNSGASAKRPLLAIPSAASQHRSWYTWLRPQQSARLCGAWVPVDAI